MTVFEDVKSLVVQRAPNALCDDCIAEILGLSVRQHANHKTRELGNEAGFLRQEGICGRCGCEKKVISKP